MTWVTHAVTLQDAASVSWMRDAGEIERDGNAAGRREQ